MKISVNFLCPTRYLVPLKYYVVTSTKVHINNPTPLCTNLLCFYCLVTFTCLVTCLFACLVTFTCFVTCLFTCLVTCLFTCLVTCLFTCLVTCLFTCLTTCLLTCPFIFSYSGGENGPVRCEEVIH